VQAIGAPRLPDCEMDLAAILDDLKIALG